MISIIVSTYRNHYLEAFKNNVRETIGVEYQLIEINNVEAKGLAEIYNNAARLAKFDILCFCHEDILFKVDNWGLLVCKTFKSEINLGLLGVAGATYKSLNPSYWSYPLADRQLRVSNVFHKDDSSNTFEHLFENGHHSFKETTTVDGVWFCVPRHVLQQFSFDDNLLKGFHGYDLDYSINVGRKYKIGVTLEIPIIHFSKGRLDSDWIKEILKVHNKWFNHLPIETADINNQVVEESKAALFFFTKMKQEGFSILEILRAFKRGNTKFKFTWGVYFQILMAIYGRQK